MSGINSLIHKYSLNGYNIVLDTNSGAVHIVDNAAYDVLDYINDGRMDKICPDNIIDELIKNIHILSYNRALYANTLL